MKSLNQPTFNGRPPKSVAQIRSLLKSIHIANEPKPVGPYINGLPETELIAVRITWSSVRSFVTKATTETRNPEYFRRLLIDKSTKAGAVVGGILGVNVGFAFAIMIGWADLVPFSIILGLFTGSLSGVAVARNCVTRRRIDLFGPLPMPFSDLLGCAPTGESGSGCGTRMPHNNRLNRS